MFSGVSGGLFDKRELCAGLVVAIMAFDKWSLACSRQYLVFTVLKLGELCTSLVMKLSACLD